MFNPEISQIITLPQAAAYAATSPSTLRRAARDGELKGIKIRETWFTTREAVDDFFKKRQSDWLNKGRREEKAAKIRAGWQCARCGEVKGEWDLSIWYKDGDETNYSGQNMVVLCFLCYTFTKRHYHPAQMVLPGMELPEWLR
jgi:hypothetical protein